MKVLFASCQEHRQRHADESAETSGALLLVSGVSQNNYGTPYPSIDVMQTLRKHDDDGDDGDERVCDKHIAHHNVSCTSAMFTFSSNAFIYAFCIFCVVFVCIFAGRCCCWLSG